MPKVTIVAVENCLVSSVVGMLDILSVANHIAMQAEGKRTAPVFLTHLVSKNGTEISDRRGIAMIPDRGIEDVIHTDIIYIPAILPPIEAVIEKSGSIVQWLKDHIAKATTIVSACTGAFLIAESGALDGKRATTHWRAIDKFKQRYPQVALVPQRAIIDEGNVITAGGYYFYEKLALYLIEKFTTPQLATLCAKTMLIDPEFHHQTAFMIFAPQQQHGDKEVLRVQQWLDQHYIQKVSVDKMASIAGLGIRNFKRRFVMSTGDTPLFYLQRLRVEAAKKLLEATMANVETITHRVGYEDVASFRKLFKKITGLSPKAYRKKFSRRLSSFLTSSPR